ncbi:unnamed protein product [Plutella xylostella]|uniref:(diamondback moth) hypothetical protein n=1 Tax=Plutella xylostella TaxID=51655 RepID=A0A8S4D677_PLUXY|nr:unnamed protein product [Plutella xylostella]
MSDQNEPLWSKFGSENIHVAISKTMRRKERGRIATESIHTVEQAQLGELSKQIPDGDAEKSPLFRFPFQVGYTELSNDYTLYLVADGFAERLHWITTIRSICVANPRRARYHPAAWSARRWGCCSGARRAPGCALAAVWPLPEPEPEPAPDTHFSGDAVARPVKLWLRDRRGARGPAALLRLLRRRIPSLRMRLAFNDLTPLFFLFFMRQFKQRSTCDY